MNKLRNIWLFFTVVTSSIVLIQLASPKYDDNKFIPLLWLLICILPLSFFVFSRRTSNVSSVQISIYGIILLAILMIEPIITKSTKISSNSVLIYSVSIALLYQTVLVLINRSKIQETMLVDNNLGIDFDRLKNLVSENFYDEVFQELEAKKAFYHQRYYNDLLLLKGKYKIQKREKNLNLASHSDTRIDDAKFLNGLLETVTEIEKYCKSKIHQNNK